MFEVWGSFLYSVSVRIQKSYRLLNRKEISENLYLKHKVYDSVEVSSQQNL